MDTGHYNCRDYEVSPHFAPAIISNGIRTSLSRHESYDELMHRSRSPASFKAKFPLLRLPLELRQEIFSYLLPRTIELKNSNPLGNHARNFSAVQKRGARGMALPSVAETARAAKVERDEEVSNVVWLRGNTRLLSVCRQLHKECAEMMYGRNTFLLFVTYLGVTFRFRWLLPSGLAPTQSYNFLELMPERYLMLLKKVVIHVDHVDSYTSMIKFNVSGKGLAHGLRKQIQRLVLALQPLDVSVTRLQADSPHQGSDDENRRLARVIVRVNNGNAVIDSIKKIGTRPTKSGQSTEGSTQVLHSDRIPSEVDEILEPFGDLIGVREVRIVGAVSTAFADSLGTKMQSTEPRQQRVCCCEESMTDKPIQLCVYGNDMA